MIEDVPELPLVLAWTSAGREAKRTLLMVLEAIGEAERVAENLWRVSPREVSWSPPPEDPPPTF